MTPIRTITRCGASWFLPLVFVLSCLFAARSTFLSGYPAGDIAQSSVGLYAAAPMTAAFMALQYRGFAQLTGPLRMARSGWWAALRAWWPLLLGAPVTLCLAVTATARSVPDDLSSWSLMLIDFMTVLAAALTGLACSWALPTVVAVPLVALTWFVWIGYGPASTNLVVHNLASTFGCCSPDTRPATVAVRATLLLLFLLSLGIGCLLAPSRSARIPRPVVAAALAAVVLVAFGGGVAVLRTSGQQLNLTATEARTTPLTCSDEQGLPVCLWPEGRDNSDALAAVVRRLNPQLRARGMAPVVRLTQAHRTPAAVSVEAGQGITEQDMRLGVAVGYVDLQTGCPRGSSGPARDQAAALVALLAGLRAEDVSGRIRPEATAAAAQALARGKGSPASVGAWFRERVRSVRCESLR